LKTVNPAGVLQVHVPTVLNATTVRFPLVVISGEQLAANELLGEINKERYKASKVTFISSLECITQGYRS
jgi:hypothetical protein